MLHGHRAYARFPPWQSNRGIRIPPIPYDPLLSSFGRAVAETIDDEEGEHLLSLLETIDKKRW